MILFKIERRVKKINYPENKKQPDKSVKKDVMRKAEETVREFKMSSKPDEFDNIQSDVLGSYTGMSYDNGKPEQDADDL